MPARLRSSSPVMWPPVPMPSDAQEMVPGFALASATNSGSVATPRRGCTTSAMVVLAIWVMGVRSRKVS